MTPPDNHTWGAHNAQHGGSALINIDENAKIFQQFLNDTAPLPRKMNKKNAYPQVQGGLPPHLLKKEEDADDRIHPDTPRATVHDSRSYEQVSDRQHSESAWSSQPVAASQWTPDDSVNLPPWEDNLRAQQMVTHDRKFPPTPTGRERAPHSPVQQPRSSMHPALQAALSKQARIREKRSPVASPGDAWLAISRRRQENRGAQTMNTAQEVEQSSHHAPDVHKKKWRPKHSSCWGSQSLPTSDASVKFGSNDANPSFTSDQSNGAVPFRDVRGSIADELDIVPKGDGTGWVNKHAWTSQDYDSPPGSDYESSHDSFEKGWHSSYCRDWVESLPERPPPLVSLPYDEAETHWECDINPKDGTIMLPVEYPQTTVNSQDHYTQEELVRRMSSTAEIKVTMEAEKLRKRMKQREQREETRGDRTRGPEWRRVTSSTPVDRPDAPGRLPHRYGQPPDQTTTALVESRRADPREPRIRCYLRSVAQDDLQQILDIYNWEVEHGCQALDAKPLALGDIHRLFAECDAAGTPFIVAVQGQPPLASTFHGEESALVRYRGPYQKDGRSRPYADSQGTPSNASSSGRVLGFGLITFPSAGLAGNVHTSVSRFNGKVHLYVEPHSRRLGVGRCILHRVLRCCSKRLQYADWYKWYDSHDSKACGEAGDNLRNYARVFVEVASFKGDPDFRWRKKLLGEMNFIYVNTTDLTRKVIQGANGGWFDNTVWQHDCGGPGDVHEYNC